MSRIVYGLNPVLECLKAEPSIVEELLVAQGRTSGRMNEILGLARSAGVKTRRRPREELVRLAGTGNHQGVVLLVGGFSYLDLESILDDPEVDLLVILDGIQDPQNLGAIARTALGAGAKGLIIPKDRAAGVTPAAMKAAAGALSRLPVARVTNLNRVAELLQEKGFWLLGTAPRAEISLFDLGDLPPKLVVVVGAEGKGVGRTLAAKCDFMAALPLSGPVESLNASAAAAVVLFELVRRRSRNS